MNGKNIKKIRIIFQLIYEKKPQIRIIFQFLIIFEKVIVFFSLKLRNIFEIIQ